MSVPVLPESIATSGSTTPTAEPTSTLATRNIEVALQARLAAVDTLLSARRMLRPNGVVDREPTGLGQPSSYELQQR